MSGDVAGPVGDGRHSTTVSVAGDRPAIPGAHCPLLELVTVVDGDRLAGAHLGGEPRPCHVPSESGLAPGEWSTRWPPLIQPGVDGHSIDAQAGACPSIAQRRTQMGAALVVDEYRAADPVRIQFHPRAGQVIEEFMGDEQAIEGVQFNRSRIGADPFDGRIEAVGAWAQIDADPPDPSRLGVPCSADSSAIISAPSPAPTSRTVIWPGQRAMTCSSAGRMSAALDPSMASVWKCPAGACWR